MHRQVRGRRGGEGGRGGGDNLHVVCTVYLRLVDQNEIKMPTHYYIADQRIKITDHFSMGSEGKG